jgi:hypothetical protein
MTMLKQIVGCCVLILASSAVANSEPSSTAKDQGTVVGNSVAANAQSVTPVAGGKSQRVEERKICRQLPSSYTRRTERVCLTAKEWEQAEREAQ